MKKNIVRRVLLILGALVLTGWLIYEFQAVAVLISSAWKWFLSSVHFVGAFLKSLIARFTASFFSRQIMRPLLVILGLAWFAGYVSKWFKILLGPTISAGLDRLKELWGLCPWYVKALVIVALVALIFFLGWGLWLIPFGLPFYSGVMGRIKASWMDSWLREKLWFARKHLRMLVRTNRHRRPVGVFRFMRLWVIRRDRKFDAKADEIIESWKNKGQQVE